MDAPPVQYAKASDGFSIAYCVSGAGRPFVFAPEPLSHLHVGWRMPARNLLFSSLSDRFMLVRYDERGNGMSQRNLPPSVSAEDFVLDIEAVADHLKLEKFVLFAGIGMGDRAVRYTVKHPERVAALLLWNATPDDPAITIRLYADVALRSWDLFIDTVAQNFGFDAPELEVQRVREASTQQDFLTKVGALKDRGIRGLLPEVRVPTLVMATRGRTVPVEAEAREIASLIPSSRLVLFETQGTHASLYRTDSQLPPAIPVIEEFLDSQGLGSDRSRPSVAQAKLSGRELEVLRLITAGRSNQQIADELVISLFTVNRHVSNIFAKTGAANRAEAASHATRQGLV
jgi:DNA-binding CsgD family transcriptional regulator/pimeloyl-ACP methyl ester carboxylesterase